MHTEAPTGTSPLRHISTWGGLNFRNETFISMIKLVYPRVKCIKIGRSQGGFCMHVWDNKIQLKF